VAAERSPTRAMKPGTAAAAARAPPAQELEQDRVAPDALLGAALDVEVGPRLQGAAPPEAAGAGTAFADRLGGAQRCCEGQS
jgi:hypothetical protein